MVPRPAADPLRSNLLRTSDVHFERTTGDAERAYVTFTAGFSGGDGSIPPGKGLRGYVLERGDDGRWVIVDAGVG